METVNIEEATRGEEGEIIEKIETRDTGKGRCLKT